MIFFFFFFAEDHWLYKIRNNDLLQHYRLGLKAKPSFENDRFNQVLFLSCTPKEQRDFNIVLRDSEFACHWRDHHDSSKYHARGVPIEELEARPPQQATPNNLGVIIEEAGFGQLIKYKRFRQGMAEVEFVNKRHASEGIFKLQRTSLCRIQKAELVSLSMITCIYLFTDGCFIFRSFRVRRTLSLTQDQKISPLLRCLVRAILYCLTLFLPLVGCSVKFSIACKVKEMLRKMCCCRIYEFGEQMMNAIVHLSKLAS